MAIRENTKSWNARMHRTNPGSPQRRSVLEALLKEAEVSIFTGLLAGFFNLPEANVMDEFQEARIRFFYNFFNKHLEKDCNYLGFFFTMTQNRLRKLSNKLGKSRVDSYREGDIQSIEKLVGMEICSAEEGHSTFHVVHATRAKALRHLLEDPHPKRKNCEALLRWHGQLADGRVPDEAYQDIAKVLDPPFPEKGLRRKINDRIHYCRCKAFQRAIETFALHDVIDWFIKSTQIKRLMSKYWEERFKLIRYVKAYRLLLPRAKQACGVSSKLLSDFQLIEVMEMILSQLKPELAAIGERSLVEPDLKLFIAFLAERSGSWRVHCSPFVPHKNWNDGKFLEASMILMEGKGIVGLADNNPIARSNLEFIEGVHQLLISKIEFMDFGTFEKENEI